MAKPKTSSFLQSKEDLKRITQIMGILAKFQLDKFVHRVQYVEKLPVRIPKQKVLDEVKLMTPQERLRALFEDLGTSFVKLGQLLATRDDIIGADYAAELSKLHDQMKPFPVAEVKRVIKRELGKSVGELFSSFDSEPMASASIAQVHRAKLKDGKSVVVKIQRPDIEKTIIEDLRIMHYIAYLADKNIPEIHAYDPMYLVDEFERSILKELDFLREAKNSKRLKENFKENKDVYIPIIYDELCTRHILTMEEIEGSRLSDIIASNSKKYNKRLIAQRCIQAFFQMILVDGFYHADPHPGNIIVMKHGVICFLDFGKCATIDKDLAGNIFRLVLFAVDNDVNGLIAHLIRIGFVEETVDMEQFRLDLTDLFDSYYSTDIRSIDIGNMFSGLMAVIGKYEFKRPRELADLTRAILILDGLSTQLDPKFNMAEVFEPYAIKYVANAFNSKKFFETLKSNIFDIEYIAKEFPGALRRLLKKASEGKITLEIEHKNLENITGHLETVSDRISVALIVAALIVGSSITGQIDKALGLVFFVASSIIGIWLVLKTLVF